MTQFKNGERVRVNEGELEGIEGFVVESNEHVTLVQMNLLSGTGIFPVFTEMLVSGKEDHPALHHLKWLYPDFLKSDRYLYRLSTYVYSVHYVSQPVNAGVLVETLEKAPAGLEKVEFMLAKDDPSRGLAWKTIWTE